MYINGYFAASNSGMGFRNYYHEIFGSADRIFIIRGGPGTGKSRFMLDVSRYAGVRGWECENYFCSSDAKSLDGVLLKRDSLVYGILDGTFPHVWEAELPGIREESIDLGMFWDSDVLMSHSEEIRILNRAKKSDWDKAYGWLSGCLDMCGIIRRAGESAADTENINLKAGEILAGIRDGSSFSRKTALIRAVGMHGMAMSGEFFRKAASLYIIKDKYLTSDILFKSLLARARKKNLCVTVSRDPVDCGRIDGIMTDDGQIAAVVGEEKPEREYTEIDMDSFCGSISETVRYEAEHAYRCYDSLLSGAIDALGDAGDCHFALEKIYAQAMDFNHKEEFTGTFCRKIFGD